MRKVIKPNEWSRGKVVFECDRCHDEITGAVHRSGHYHLCAECARYVRIQEEKQMTMFYSDKEGGIDD